MKDFFIDLRRTLSEVSSSHPVGRITSVRSGLIEIGGLEHLCALGDRVAFGRGQSMAEVTEVAAGHVVAIAENAGTGLSVGDEVGLLGPPRIFPCSSWVGRIIDPLGRPLDGKPLGRGSCARTMVMPPPPASERRSLGTRLETGLACFDTVLPIAKGQRIGLFAGSGVGKSMLLGTLAKGVEADVVVVALVGERGRELRDFVQDVLGPDGLSRSVLVVATSDQSALMRRQCLLSAMATAEYFRDMGKDVLMLADSVTRFAEAHREIALTAGEQPSLKGYPPSVQTAIMGMAERAGPGTDNSGDITAIFSVLVPGSDMEEPIADILRGVLDGHIVLDRQIAERGRFPAVDLLRSVSRCLPKAATTEENDLILDVRRIISCWENAELMVQSGLYKAGTDPQIDRAIKKWPKVDAFLSRKSGHRGRAESFELLKEILYGP